MAITALFFNFSKRKNSLKVPVDNTGTTFNVNLKQPCSYQEPVLTLSNSGFSYNYAKFEGNYYFVSDIVSLRADLWEVHLTKDVLASYRSEILAQSAYVLYDTVGNADIVDTRLAVSTVPSVDSSAVAFPGVDPTIGRYILAVVGQNSCAAWAIPYRMNPAAVVNAVFVQNTLNVIDVPANAWSDNNPADFKDALREQSDLLDKIYSWFVAYDKKKATQILSSGDALSAIRGCIWIPFDFSTDATDAGSIYLGNYDTGYTAIKLGTSANPMVKTLTTVTVNIPWQHSDFRRNSPYTKVYLYIPFIGVVELSASSLIGAASLSVTAALNVVSGDLSVRVSCGSQTIGTYGANVAVPVQLGSSQATPKQMYASLISGAVGTVAGLATGNVLAAGAAALAGVAGASVAGISGHPTSVGGLSSGAASGLLTNIVCFTVCHDTVVAPSSVASSIGRPSYAVKALSGLSGYCQTAEFSLNAAAADEDRVKVNNFMNSGVFIE